MTVPKIGLKFTTLTGAPHDNLHKGHLGRVEMDSGTFDPSQDHETKTPGGGRLPAGFASQRPQRPNSLPDDLERLDSLPGDLKIPVSLPNDLKRLPDSLKTPDFALNGQICSPTT